MDIIFIEDLQIETIIGIYDWERTVHQVVSLDIEMAADASRAAASDQVEDTINYKKISKRLIQFVGESEFQLVETLAEQVAGVLMREFGISWLRVKLSKPGALRNSKNVGVLIERGQKPR